MKMKIAVCGMLLCLPVIGLCYLFSIKDIEKQNYMKWEKLTESWDPDRTAFSPIFFFDKNNGITLNVVSIKRTIDGGRSWNTIYEYDGKAFYSIAFEDEQNGWIVGADENSKPLILKTEDKGINWQKVNIDESLSKLNGKINVFYDICFDQFGESWIAGDGGVIRFNSKDLKISSIFFTDEKLSSIACSSSNDIWAVGNNGSIFHHQNGWIRQKVVDNVSFIKVKTFGDSVWTLGYSRQKTSGQNEDVTKRGVLLRSGGKEQDWEDKTPPDAEDLFDLYFDGENGLLVGSKGSIYSTGDNGNSWVNGLSPSKNDLYSIFFFNSRNGWISGDRSTVLRYQE